MDMPKLLIADGNDIFRQRLAEALQSAYTVRTCSTGKEALSLLHSFGPDVLVLDLMLPQMDGISLLEHAAAGQLRPKVLATTRLLNDYIYESVARLGVEYVMMRPCDIPSTVARIRDLSRRLNPLPRVQTDPQTQVSDLLLSLGIPTRLKGYQLAREAILLMANNPDLAITKELYPIVASICDCHKDHVERSIRSAVTSAWNNRDDRIWQLYFTPGADGIIKRPSNGTFITRLADSLRVSRTGSNNF